MSVAIASEPGWVSGSRTRRALFLGAVLSAGGAGMLLVASRIANGSFPYPGCGFKHLTGLACPGCGGVRSLTALAVGELGEALRLNPMAALLGLGLLAAFPLALADVLFNRGRAGARLGTLVEHRALGWIMTGVVAANWLYLLVVGR